jgi:hypothetical protein
MSPASVHSVPVDSSLLVNVAYDASTLILQLTFHSGARYRYFDVPARVYTALLAAESKGAYFNQSIRGHFAFALVP